MSIKPSKQFGTDTKSFKIGEKPRPKTRLFKIPGPGEYNESSYLTKIRSPEIRLDSGIKRPDHFTKVTTYDAEPGMYLNTEPDFGKDTKPIKISNLPKEKKGKQPPEPGPYNISTADSLTKARLKTPNIRFDHMQKERPDHFTTPRTNDAEPGTYNVQKPFGSDAKSFKISTV